MTNSAATLLARLNDLRTRNDLKPLKHPMPIAKMEKAIADLTPNTTSEIAEYARSKGVNPKVARALLRRHFEKPATGWALTNEIKQKIDESATRKVA